MARARRANLTALLEDYLSRRQLDLEIISRWECRVLEPGGPCIEIWLTTGDFAIQDGDRDGERGILPENIENFLDELFYGKE